MRQYFSVRYLAFVVLSIGLAPEVFAQSAQASTPIGTVVVYAGPITEQVAKELKSEGWLPCDGRPVNRAEYQTLFNRIGDLWGSGDRTTTFNLPNLESVYLIGASPIGPPKPDSKGDKNVAVGAQVGADTHTHTMKNVTAKTAKQGDSKQSACLENCQKLTADSARKANPGSSRNKLFAHHDQVRRVWVFGNSDESVANPLSRAVAYIIKAK